MSKIYNEEGYVNWDYIVDQTKAFCMVTGSRGTGKTYGLLKYMIEHGEKFIYLRRLQTQLDECSKQEGNPFKKINNDCGYSILPFKSGNTVKFCEAEVMPNGKVAPVEKITAIGCALSTFATIRGADYSDVTAILFDEAIAMESERPIKGEFQAFLNFYETVNRNRELQGLPPVKCFMLGNANKLANPYYAGWAFMRTALKMIRGGQMMWRSQDGTRIMIMLLNSPISDRKAKTALYQNAKDDFIAMAIDNAFRTDETNIRSWKLSEFNHVVSIGELGVYQHKSGGWLYISKTVNKTHYYDGYGVKLTMFRRDYMILKYKYLSQMLTFEDFDCELIFREYLNIT